MVLKISLGKTKFMESVPSLFFYSEIEIKIIPGFIHKCLDFNGLSMKTLWAWWNSGKWKVKYSDWIWS